jgi:hypothetical protein
MNLVYPPFPFPPQSFRSSKEWDLFARSNYYRIHNIKDVNTIQNRQVNSRYKTIKFVLRAAYCLASIFVSTTYTTNTLAKKF